MFWELALFYSKLRNKPALPLLVLLTKAPGMCVVQETNKWRSFPATRLLAKYFPGRFDRALTACVFGNSPTTRYTKLL